MIPSRNEEITNAINPKFLGISFFRIKEMPTKISVIPSKIQKISAALVKLNAVVKTNKTNITRVLC